MLILTFAAILVVALLAHLAGRSTAHVEPSPRGAALGRALDSRAILAVVFAITFVVLRYSWASWNPVAAVHDEMAYLLQAEIFAQGRWAMPSPPMPAFWEQPHVLVQPALAAKYFPGHALVMTLGALAGWPPLVPLALQSLAGVLTYLLARRLAGGPVALLTWVIWLSTPMVLHFGPSYYSEATTTACWLGGWYALLQWRTDRRLRWLLLVAACTGWCFVTRPLTGVAYAIPVGLVVLRDTIRLRRWRDLGLALALGSAVLAIIPLWSARTTGDWRTTPLLLYTHQYMPYDVPGFGLLTTPPALEVSPELARLNKAYGYWHIRHVPIAMAYILVIRSKVLAVTLWGTSKGVLMLFAALGLLALTAESAFAVVGSVLLVVIYLVFATPPQWTLYYYESSPAFAFLTASGLAWAASMIGRPRGVVPSPSYDWRARRWMPALLAGALLIAVPGAAALRQLRAAHSHAGDTRHDFEVMRAGIPPGKAVVFVQYAPQHDPNVSFVQNFSDLAGERVWAVRDRGRVENARFLALVPDRTAYIFVEAQRATFRYDPNR